MKTKITVLFTLLTLIILSVSCEKEVELNYENLQGKWDSNETIYIYDFNTSTNELTLIPKHEVDTVIFNFQIIDKENVSCLNEEGNPFNLKIVFLNKRKIRIYGIVTIGTTIPENQYIEVIKMLE